MALYRLLQCLVVPLQIARAVWLALAGRESFSDLRDRLFGFRILGPSIWLHGASVGELASARSVVEALRRQRPDLRIIITTDRATARDRANGWSIDGLSAHLAPLDLSTLTRSLLRRSEIKVLLSLENELWPARMSACHAADVPVILLAARLSDASTALWRRFPRIARAILAPVTLVLPQNAETAERLRTLGVRSAAIGPKAQLKAAYEADIRPVPEDFAGWQRPTTLLAASTHEGEEAILLDAFAMARAIRPGLRLILAPRHTDRADAIVELATARGLAVAQRSRGDRPDTDVYLADTMGEMSYWYRIAGLCFLGGSLVPKGGHTPYEPIAYGCPILHGPHVDNFSEDYARLKDFRGAAEVKATKGLVTAILAHMDDAAMADRAAEAVTGPDPDAVARQILAALDPRPQPV